MSPFGWDKGVNFFSHMYASQSWLGWTSDALSWDNLSPYERDLSEGGWVLASVLLHVFLDLSLNSAVADPGEGAGGRGGGGWTPQPNWGPKKDSFGDRAPRYLRVWMTTRSGSDTAQSIQIKKNWAKEPNIPPSWSLPNAPVCAKKRQREPTKYLLINCRECKPHFTVFNTA